VQSDFSLKADPDHGCNRESGSPDGALARSKFALPIIIVAASFVFFWALGEAPYWDRDEPRNAGCAAEMLARGDWIVPTFNDELRGQKPVLLYWLMMLSYQVFGINEFAGRFFSALLAIGTVIATWGIAKSLFDRTVAMLASLALASSLMFGVAARAATPDSLLIFCTTAAIWFFVNGLGRGKTVGRLNPFDFWKTRLGIYLCLGFAVLAKGPVGFVLPMAVMGWFLLQQRSLLSASSLPVDEKDRASIPVRIIRSFGPKTFLKTLLSMRPVSGTAISLGIAAPWFVAAGFATNGEFTRRFFVDENFGRAMSSFENHGGGFWFYPVAILIGFFPWSTFWGPVVTDIVRRAFKESRTARSDQPMISASVRFCLAWAIIQVVAFSLVQTKLPSYVTPCYPALSILTSASIIAMIRNASFAPHWLWNLAHGALVFSGIGIAGAAWFASTVFEPIPSQLALAGLFPVAMGIFGIWLTALTTSNKRNNQQSSLQMPQQKELHRLPAALAVGAILFSVSLLGAGAAAVGKNNTQPISEFLKTIDEESSVATYGCLESSWVYYSERPIFELQKNSVGASPTMARKHFWQNKPRPAVQQFVRRTGTNYILTTQELLPELKNRLPEDWNVLQTADWFLKDKKLVLLGVTPNIASKPTNESPSRR
jgi:4-amino-4-deoxy-L-arabinose transferase-like glycosyltransferase